jgi:hypothetical protein
MRRLMSWLAIGGLCLAARVDAQASAEHRFAPLEFLVGSCWVGTFGDGKTTDTHCFEWKYGTHFIRDHHVVSSTPAYEGETMYSWDAAERRVVFRYWSNDGLVLDGSVSTNGEEIVFPGRYANADGSVTELMAVWTRLGRDAYRAVQSEKGAAGWKEVMRVEYRRK